MADIAGSSRLWNRHPELMSVALARHDSCAELAVRETGGRLFKHTGDGFIASFTDVDRALDAMIAYQRSLPVTTDDTADAGIELRSRVAIHFGPAEPRGADWFGPTINQLARLTDLVAPTHVVLSGAAARRVDGHTVACDHLGDFPVHDSADPVALYAARFDGAIGPALTVDAGRGLPRFHTALVGREGEVAELLALLERERLVTVLGFGGMGKTHLAVESARQWSEDHRAPAYFADLSTGDDPLAVLCDAVGVGRAPRDGPAEAIARQLAHGPALLVVDNCEHVIETASVACAALVDAAPELRVLTTSREALEVDAEVLLPLDSLAPDAAVTLLRRRAEALGCGTIDEADAARLCDRVAGMPLGIELVAARLRQVDPATLGDMLDDGLDELRVRRRRAADATAGDRHATMRSLVAWSYDLLDTDEQVLLLRLSQLPAPWPRGAADVLGRDLVPNRLDELVAKSLVAPSAAGQLRMLEPVRRCCTDLLDADPARLGSARGLLVDWALGFVPELPDDQDPVYDVQGARRIVAQLPNIRATLAAAKATDRHEDEAEIVIRLWPLTLDGRVRSWFGPQIDDTLARTVEPRLRRVLIRLALQDTLENYVDLEREEELVSLLREVDPDRSSAEWSAVEGGATVKQMVVDRLLGVDPAATRQVFSAAIDVARSRGRRLDAAMAHLLVAQSHLLHGEYDPALLAAEEAADGARRVNFEAVTALADATGAMALQCLGHVHAGLEIADAAVPLAEHARWETSVRTVRALLLGRVGRVDEAFAEVATTIDLALAQPVPFLLSDAAIALASVRMTVRDLTGAAAALDLAGVARTPLTIAVMFELAREIEFDLGLDRFAESLDPDAVARRAVRAADALERARSELG